MDFHDVFRSFFGTFGPRGSRFNEDDEFDGADFFSTSPPSDSHGNRDDDDDNDNMTFGGGQGGSFPPHGGDFFFRFEEDTRDMFSHFEEMFRNFRINEFPPSVFSEAERKAPPPSLPASSKHRSPRDLMLKHPDSDEPPTSSTIQPDQAGKNRLQGDQKGNPSSESPSWFSLWTSKPEWQWTLPSLPSSTHRQDKDIDEQVQGKKLEEIFTQTDPSSSPSPPSAIFRQTPTIRSYSKSISIQTVRKPDGTVEQRRTETDGDGNVTTTVTSTNPNEGRNSHPWPSWRKPACQRSPTTDQFRNRIEDTPSGQAKTDSIFQKLSGSWSRDDDRW